MNAKDHIGKIIVGVGTAAIIGSYSLLSNLYYENAWAGDIQQFRKEWKDASIKRLRRELNEIEQKTQDGTATKYDRLRKIQLERDYNEELTK